MLRSKIFRLISCELRGCVLVLVLHRPLDFAGGDLEV